MMENIIWITLDSVRADHTTMGGYNRDTTPNLQRIANLPDGCYFQNCISTGNVTPTSSASILTGTYPSRHGFRMTNDFLPERLSTVPELFGEQGFATAGLSRNSYLSEGSGLDRGFDRFKWIGGSNFLRAVHPITILKFIFNLHHHSAGLTRNTAKHSTPFILNDMIKRWLSDFGNHEPIFLYSHYNEPHRPFYPPNSFRNRFTEDFDMSPKSAADLALRIHNNVPKIIANEYKLSPTEERALIAMYDAEIAYTDECIGRLFDFIQESSLGETIFIVTADHGEFLGEHNLYGHTLRLDDAVINVPLVVHGLSEVDNHRESLVQHIDLMQTLLARVGGRIDQFQGVDLRHDHRTFSISQQSSNDFQRYLEINPEFDTSRFHSKTLTALRTNEFKYLKSDDNVELYEFPDEEQNRRSEYPEIAEKLDDELDWWWEKYGQPIEETKGSRFSPGMKDQLRQLGYLE